jgi:hypothetical protein
MPAKAGMTGFDADNRAPGRTVRWFGAAGWQPMAPAGQFI